MRLTHVREVADGTQDCLLVRLHTDDGITGLGEVTSCSHVARAVIEAPRSAPFRHGLAAVIEGLDPTDRDGVIAAMEEGTSWYGPEGVLRHAMSAIDIALWDICGKTAGQPVRGLLDDGAPATVACYASVYCPDTPEQVAAVAGSFREQGCRAVKFGWGPFGRHPSRDVELVAAAREALGPQIELMMDAGRAWDVDTALERADLLAPFDLHWLEEPLQPHDVVGYRRLGAASPVPIAAGEALTAVADFEQLLVAGGIDVVQPDLGHIGGISFGQRVAALATRCQARAVPHAFGTGVLQAASAHWAAAHSGLTEYTQSASPLTTSLVRHSMRFVDGALNLGDEPGLGVELDEEVLRQFLVN